MLTLNRSLKEEIVIGNELIVLKILNLNYHEVRLGILAPNDMSVHRREIFEKIKSTNLAEKNRKLTISNNTKLLRN